MIVVDGNPSRIKPGWYVAPAQLVLSVWADARHSLDRPRLDVRYVVPGRFRVRAVDGGYCTLQTMEGDKPATVKGEKEWTESNPHNRPRSWGPG